MGIFNEADSYVNTRELSTAFHTMIYRYDPLLGLTFPIHRAIILRETRSLGNGAVHGHSCHSCIRPSCPPTRKCYTGSSVHKGYNYIGRVNGVSS